MADKPLQALATELDHELSVAYIKSMSLAPETESLIRALMLTTIAKFIAEEYATIFHHEP